MPALLNDGPSFSVSIYFYYKFFFLDNTIFCYVIFETIFTSNVKC